MLRNVLKQWINKNMEAAMKAVTDENTPISQAAKDHGVPVSRQNFWKGVPW